MNLNQTSKTNLEETKEDIAFCLLKEKVESGKILSFEVTSSYSMSPFLSQDDSVLVREIKFEDLRKGDIIVFRLNERLCVHRYIHPLKSPPSYDVQGLKKKNNSFALITKGDNVLHFDRLPVSKEHFIGKVISIRKSKRTINLERASWKIINYLLANISAAQAYLPPSLRAMRKLLLGNRKFPPGTFIKKGLSFVFSASLKLVVYITKIIPSFYRKA